VPTGGLPSWGSSPVTGGLPTATPGAPVPVAPISVAPISVAAAAPGGANDTYLGSRLVYSPAPEPTFDPVGSGRFLAQLAQRAVLYLLAHFFGYIVFSVLALLIDRQAIVYPVVIIISAFASSAGTTASGIGLNAGGEFLAVVFTVFDLTLFLCFWFLKLPIQLSEWKLTVDGKAPAAPRVFNHIASVLRARETPIEPLRVQRFRLPNTPPREYLELHSGIFYGYIACFAYGEDLYVGWTFWIRISPVQYVGMFLGRIFQSMFNKSNDLYVSLRYDSARALRETIHNASREGVDFAIAGIDTAEPMIVGTAIPVVDNVQ
jgi:hypothetical protein